MTADSGAGVRTVSVGACRPSANQSVEHEHRLRRRRASGLAACSGAAAAAGARRAGLAIGRVHVA